MQVIMKTYWNSKREFGICVAGLYLECWLHCQ